MTPPPQSDDRVIALIRSNFDDLNRRFDTVNDRFDRIEGKLDDHHQMLGKHEEALEHLEARMEQISARTHKTNNDIQGLVLSGRTLALPGGGTTSERMANEDKPFTPYQLRWLFSAAAAGGGIVWWFVNYMATHAGKLPTP